MAELTPAEGTNQATYCCAPEQPASGPDIREQVRQRYAAAASTVTSGDAGAGCCVPSETFDGGSDVFGAALYGLGDREQIPIIRARVPESIPAPS
jgi:hypothetical protein